MLRLKTTKLKLYKLVSGYEELPPMRNTTFWKAFGRPDYFLEWPENDGGIWCRAFLVSCVGKPLLTIEKKEICGPQVSRTVHTLDLEDLQARGMVEKFFTAAERRKMEAANGRM